MADLRSRSSPPPDLVRSPRARSPDSRVSPGRGSRQALCLWLPTFELRLELVRSPELDATSVALLAPGEGARKKIWQVSERASVAGVRPGMLISQAVSLCPVLTLLEPDPAHYDATMEEILEALVQLSPVVEPSGRGCVFVGADGLERLHGGPEGQVDAAFRTLLHVLPRPLLAALRVGQAAGKFGSWVAAVRSRPGRPVLVPGDGLREFLSGCPVSALPVDDRMVERLERLGIETLGELAALPEPALVGQFGEDGRRARSWATGRRIDPVRPLRRPRPIRVSLDFTVPVGRTGTLHGALDRLLDRALSRPARRGRSVQGIRAGGYLEGGGSWFVEVVLREPTSHRDRIAFALRSKMELAPPPRAVETLLVELFRFGPPSAQAGLFDRREAAGREAAGRTLADGAVPPALREAVKELKLKLGYSPLYRVVEVDPWSRIPERRHALLNFDP